MTIIIKYTSDIATQAHVVPNENCIAPALSMSAAAEYIHGYDTKWCVFARILLSNLFIEYRVCSAHIAPCADGFTIYMYSRLFFCSFNSLRLIRQLKLKSWSWATQIGQLLGWFCREYIAGALVVGFHMVFTRFGAKKEFRVNGWWSRFLTAGDYSGLNFSAFIGLAIGLLD